MDVLFVCLGNICRSPMAEGILKELYKQRNISGNVASVGLMDWNADKAADHRAVSVAQENGIDIASHRARQIRREDFEKFDLVLAMDGHNIRLLETLAPPEHKHKVKLLLGTEEVRDPYRGNEEDFRTAFKLMRIRLEQILEEEESRH